MIATGSASDQKMTYLRQSQRVTADQVADVRRALAETQYEFSRRFERSRFSVIRWESNGVKFKYKSQHWRAWQGAVIEAIELTKGADNEPIENLRVLRVFST